MACAVSRSPKFMPGSSSIPEMAFSPYAWEFSTTADLNLPPGNDANDVIAKVGDIRKGWDWYVIERDGFQKPNRFGYAPDGYSLQIEAAYPPGAPPTVSGTTPDTPATFSGTTSQSQRYCAPTEVGKVATRYSDPFMRSQLRDASLSRQAARPAGRIL
jgi:hypothetical protein